MESSGSRTNDLEVEELFDGKAGIMYIVHVVSNQKNPSPKLIGVPKYSNRMKIFLNLA